MNAEALVFAEPLLLRPMALSICLGLLAALGFALLRPWPPRKPRLMLFALAAVLTLLAVGGLLRQRTVEIDPAAGTVAVHERFLGIGPTQLRALDGATRVRVSPARDSAARVGPRKTVPMRNDRFDLALEFPDEAILLGTVSGVLKAENAARGLSMRLDLPAARKGYALRAGTGIDDARAFELQDGRIGAQFELEPIVQILDSPDQSSPIRSVPQPEE